MRKRFSINGKRYSVDVDESSQWIAKDANGRVHEYNVKAPVDDDWGSDEWIYKRGSCDNCRSWPVKLDKETYQAIKSLPWRESLRKLF
jgi:hypothetical protein